MDSEPPVLQTDLRNYLPLIASGKVREIYELDQSTLLFVTTDRVSAYDVILKNGIPAKGFLLSLLSVHWITLLQTMIPTLRTHFISLSIPPTLQQSLPPHLLSQLEHRCMQVHRFKVFPIEAIVRGYITGSAWKEYTEKNTVHGIQLSGPNGRKLIESERLVKPLYTPSTKAEAGAKDENIHPDSAADIVGVTYAKRIQELSLEIYEKAAAYALTCGIIIADTKFEFGLDDRTDEVVLIDEVLTPDSSRFWPACSYKVGGPQESFDKQYLRGLLFSSPILSVFVLTLPDWLTNNGLKGKEGVELPEEVVKKTGEKYIEAYEKLSKRAWDHTSSKVR
ncbi:Bifunctional purine biosynthetic protein ade1 [Pseudocyphellaria aurata]|nr:Bifunctional purine biosynthetic protein ade1 [Pseudocyphellaria aurata]